MWRACQVVGVAMSFLAKIANAEPATKITPKTSCGTLNFSLKTKYEIIIYWSKDD